MRLSQWRSCGSRCGSSSSEALSSGSSLFGMRMAQRHRLAGVRSVVCVVTIHPEPSTYFHGNRRRAARPASPWRHRGHTSKKIAVSPAGPSTMRTACQALRAKKRHRIVPPRPDRRESPWLSGPVATTSRPSNPSLLGWVLISPRSSTTSSTSGQNVASAHVISGAAAISKARLPGRQIPRRKSASSLSGAHLQRPQDAVPTYEVKSSRGIPWLSSA